MEHVTFVALLCCCLLITTGTDPMCLDLNNNCNYWASDGHCDNSYADYMHVNCPWSCDKCAEVQHAGNVKMEKCNEGFINIRKNTNNTILCKGFNKRDSIVWTFTRNGEDILVAMCDVAYCTVYQSDVFALESSESESTLFYQQYDREVDNDTTVTCKSQFAGTERSLTCKINVIDPAKLSSCAVEEDRASRTVRGSCRFDHAFSDRRGFFCTWYRETDGKTPTPFTGVITYNSSSDGSSGWCTFTSTVTTWKPGIYTYSINFDPGPGNITVHVGKINTTPETPNVNSVPVGAIVGGIVAVVAIIVVLVVVVVVIRRKRKQKPAGSTNGSGDAVSKVNNDFEEHVNPMYVTSDVPDGTHTTDHKPSAIALRISPNSHNGHPAAPHSLDADMYTNVDGEARHAPSSAAGGYEDIGFGNNGNKRVPQKDEYAVVDKSRAKERLPANTSGSSPAHTTEGSNEYAVVDKSSSRNKAAKNIKVAEAETEGAAYAQVQKSKPVVKPKTSTKPSSDKDVTQRGAADDDEYHTLSHTRGSPHTQDQADLEPQYSHIGHD